jgi:hypothetical protein
VTISYPGTNSQYRICWIFKTAHKLAFDLLAEGKKTYIRNTAVGAQMQA